MFTGERNERTLRMDGGRRYDLEPQDPRGLPSWL